MAFLGKLVLGLLLLDLLLVWTEYSIGLYSSVPAEAASIRAVLFGEYWWAFWVVQLALGAIIPILLLVFRGRSVWAVATAGAMIAIAFLSVRLNIVLPGLAMEELEGLRSAFTGPGLTFQLLSEHHGVAGVPVDRLAGRSPVPDRLQPIAHRDHDGGGDVTWTRK